MIRFVLKLNCMVCFRSLYPPSREILDQMKDGIESLSYTGNYRDFIENLAFSKYLKQYRGCYALFYFLKMIFSSFR